MVDFVEVFICWVYYALFDEYEDVLVDGFLNLLFSIYMSSSVSYSVL